MIKKIICFMLFLFLIMESSSSALTQNNFYYLAPVKDSLEKDKLYQIHLDHLILQKSKIHYRDIRLLAQDNSEIPYTVINTTYPRKKDILYTFKITNYDDTEDESTIFIELPERHKAIDKIEFHISDRNFKQTIDIYGSDNKRSWHFLTSDKLYDFSSQIDVRKTSVSFPSSDFSYFRIHLKHDSTDIQDSPDISVTYKDLDFNFSDMVTDKKLRINKITGRFSQTEKREAVIDELSITHFTSDMNKDGDTVITINGGLPFEKIDFTLENTYFYRKVSIFGSTTGKKAKKGKKDSFRLLASGHIYRFPLDESTEMKTTITGRGEKYRFYQIIIKNNDNPPLKVKNIAFKWIRKSLFFISLHDNIPYTLCVGHSRLSQPSYDISRFIHQTNWYKQNFTPASLSPLKKNPDFTPPSISKSKQEIIEKTVFTLIVIIVVIGLSLWVFRLMKKIPGDDGNKE